MTQWERVVDALGHEWRRLLGRGRNTARRVSAAASDPTGAARASAKTLASLGRLLAPADESPSALLRPRSLSLRFDTLHVSLERLKAAAKKAEGRLNDAFVAGVCGGLRIYHERHGTPVRELRMTMPINLRDAETEHVAGNQFAPARFTVPVGIVDPVERMRALQRLVAVQRAEPALPFMEEISSVFSRLPSAVSTWLMGSMLKGIDLVTSNVPGPQFEVFVSGARIEEIYGFGPLGGAAINVTLFSYNGEVWVAINTDRAAVPDPEVFRESLEAGFAEVIAVGGSAKRESAAPGVSGSSA